MTRLGREGVREQHDTHRLVRTRWLTDMSRKRALVDRRPFWNRKRGETGVLGERNRGLRWDLERDDDVGRFAAALSFASAATSPTHRERVDATLTAASSSAEPWPRLVVPRIPSSTEVGGEATSTRSRWSRTRLPAAASSTSTSS